LAEINALEAIKDIHVHILSCPNKCIRMAPLTTHISQFDVEWPTCWQLIRNFTVGFGLCLGIFSWKDKASLYVFKKEKAGRLHAGMIGELF
jgi:hypothetical protein